jgi:DNA-binding PadR family transcriptional regulator
VRYTLPSLRVLAAFCDAAGRKLSGADVAKATGLASGTLYPILLRYEEAGFLSGEWETAEPSRLGRPRRRYYRLTAQGAREAAAALAQLHLTPSAGRFAWR